MTLLGVRGPATTSNISARPKHRVLYITHSAGYKHAVIPQSEEILKELASRSDSFTVTASQDCSLISETSLKQYDAVLSYTTGELPISDEQKNALLKFVKSGKGFAGVHSATDTFYKWPEYGAMIGGYFDNHPWHQEVVIKVEDQH